MSKERFSKASVDQEFLMGVIESLSKNRFSKSEGNDLFLVGVMASIKELEDLRFLRRNLESGVIIRISPDLVKLLMERDWTNG